jgi:hypothetical protein
VFGSYTGTEADGERTVEVPAGVTGPYTIILKGETEGPFRVTVTSLYKGTPVVKRELSGKVRRGERLTAQATHQFDGSADDPKTAKVSGLTVSSLEATTAPLPPAVSSVPWPQLAGK